MNTALRTLLALLATATALAASTAVAAPGQPRTASGSTAPSTAFSPGRDRRTRQRSCPCT
jgi:hypothetical protein